MSKGPGIVATESVPVTELLARLRETQVFAEAEEAGLLSLGELDLVRLEQGEELSQDASRERHYVAVLEGKVRVQIPDPAVPPIPFFKGESFGEIPILANKRLLYTISAAVPTVLVLFSEEKFWKLMFSCPRVREEILGNMARRLEAYQAQEVRREKLSALGALAAGLMHELKNPSAAAIRAASQMRENMMRLQQLTLKLSRSRPNPDQLECISELQQRAMTAACCPAMSSIEQSDAEEELERQLTVAGVENGWRVASTLVSMGMTAEQLSCVRKAFTGDQLCDPLNWLESLVSSVQLVGTMEESLGRVKELIMAVKHYSYEEDPTGKPVDIHDSIQSTLLILGHKMRQKGIAIERIFAKNLPLIQVRSAGLNQVWTNLLDNAIDASPEHSVIEIRSWRDGDCVCVAIEDHGSGIAPGDAQHVFEPFFTTKAKGEGTGLGLDIVHRIVGMKLGGTIRFESIPGKTVFTVSLPIEWKKDLHPAT